MSRPEAFIRASSLAALRAPTADEARPAMNPMNAPVLTGTRFWKLSGSGNDFVVFNVQDDASGAELLGAPEVVRSLCAPGTGVGADGVVLLAEPDEQPDGRAGEWERNHFRMIYFNRDGSRGEMCGNAALCSTRLAVHLGLAPAEGMRFETDSGVVASRIVEGEPEIDMAPVSQVAADFRVERKAGERRIGFALVGVPHLVVLCDEVDSVDVTVRGPELRHHPALAAGANVNFVARTADGTWLIRTFERGVEGETLACGTGVTAASILLKVWGELEDATESASVAMRSRSGLTLTATPGRVAESEWRPRLRGSARIVFKGELGDF